MDLIFQRTTRNDQTHHSVGALEDSMNANISQIPFDSVIGQIAVTAVQLQARVDNFKTNITSETLSHCNVDCSLWMFLIDLLRRMSNHQTSRMQLRCHVGQFELHVLEVRKRMSELLALLDVVFRLRQDLLRSAKTARSCEERQRPSL